MVNRVAKPGWMGIVRLLAAPLIAVVLAGTAATISFGLMGSLDQYQPALAFAQIIADADTAVPPASLLPTRTARRVLLVVVDGLRADTSETLPFLNELRQRGYSGRLTVSQPTYSKPGYAAIAAGATQEVTGVVLNSHAGLTPAETIFAVAAKNGLKTSAIADDWWNELCGSAVTFRHYYPDATFNDPNTDQDSTASAIASLATEGADLTLVHYAATDTQAHETGGAASAEYTDAATRIDGLIRELAAQLDLSRDAIIVTADHGHLSRNMGPGSGHGGWEPEVVAVPLVAAGAGISAGTLAETLPDADLTPTVAALLGLPAPADSQGRIIFPMLSADSSQKAALAVANARRLAIFTPAYTTTFGSAGPKSDGALSAALAAQTAGDFGTAYTQAEASISNNLAAMVDARQAAAAHGRSSRLPLAIIELVALAAAFWGAARLAGPGRRIVPVVCGAVFLLIDFAIYRVVLGGTYSLGALADSDIATMVRLFAIPAYVAALVAVAAAVLTFRPRMRAERVALVEAALVGCAGAGFIIAIYGLWQHGTVLQPLLPDFHVAFLTLAYLLKGTFLAALFVLLPAVAAAWPVRRAAGAPGAAGAPDATGDH